MNHAAENELFSAYLDGELTADEEVRVEQMLAASPAAQQLMDELRALSYTLQSLPAEKLSEDISPRVLRAIERRLLKGAPEPRKASSHTRVAGLEWTTLASRLFRPRVIAWSALAVAIALMFTLRNPGPRELAQAPAGKVDSVGPASRTSHDMPTMRAAPPERSATPQSAKPSVTAPAPVEALAQAKAPQRELVVSSERKEVASNRQRPAISPPALTPSPSPASGRGEHAQTASGTPASGKAEPVQTASQEAIAPGQSPWVVRCDVPTHVLDRGLLDRLLAEQHIAPQPDSPNEATSKTPAAASTASSGRTIRIRAKASDVQFAALLAQMKAHPEAFSSITVESSPSTQARVAENSQAPQPAATAAAAATTSGVAASVRIQRDLSKGPPKASLQSRVLFDRNPPPSADARSHRQAEASTPEADSRPIVLVLHVLDSANPPSAVESGPAKH